jgi:predicted dehydrogenase
MRSDPYHIPLDIWRTHLEKAFKIGFVGAGGIALTHMKYLSAREGVEIASASDISGKALEIAQTQYKIAHVYSDFKQMLKERKELDAVSVCTPNGLHAPNTIAALEAGKHVLVEKPMAMNAKEAQSMLDAAKKAGKHLVVGFQSRFDSKTDFIRKQIQSGAFGDILYVRAQALRRRGIPNWGVFGRKDLQGGGPMIDIGVHILETAHYMMGAPRPVSCTGNTWTFMGNKASDVVSVWPNWDYKTYTVEDMAVGMIRFETGAMLTIEASFIAHIEKDIFNIEVMGTKGGANWDATQIFTDHSGYMMNMSPAWVPRVDIFQVKMRHFVEVCRGKRANESPGEHGLLVQRMLDGVYESAAQGKEVTLE